MPHALFLLLFAFLLFIACNDKLKKAEIPYEPYETKTEIPHDTIIDSRDGKTYRIVKIGEQTWMAENLNYETRKSLCYEDAEPNCLKYGRLYDWNTAKRVCPSGWHLPSWDEWEVLINLAGGMEVAGKKLKSQTGWRENHDATDEFGFSAMPGGDYWSSGKIFGVGYKGNWWSATEHNEKADCAYGLHITDNNDRIDRYGNYSKEHGASVRCVQGDDGSNNRDSSDIDNGDDGEKSESFADIRNGQIYRTIKMGNRTWMAENLNYKAGSSWCYNNDESYCEKYGRLYDWFTAKNVCPNGWHLPSNAEWEFLVKSTKYEDVAGKRLKSKTGWRDAYKLFFKSGIDSVLVVGNGSDMFGFSALPGGSRGSDGNFYVSGLHGYWWSATEKGDNIANYRHISSTRDVANEVTDSKIFGLSVRCVLD
jgi:uncharacterized protein (TIGR02145 family)